MTHWYDVVFWIFFGAGLLFIAGIIIRLIVEAVRDRRPTRTYGGSTAGSSSYETTWGVGGSDSSTGFDSASSTSSDSSSDSGGSDSGGGFESGGGDSGGGGSSGGWND